MAAADETDPVEQVTSFLEGLAAQAPADEGAPSPQAVPAPPAFEVPPEIRDAFQQLADAAGLPENCVDGVADAIELIVNGLIALPLELAGLLADLLGLLGEGGVPLPTELQGLLDQLLGGLEGEESPAPETVATEEAPEASAGALALPIDGLPGGQPEEEAPEGPAPGGEEAPELPTLVEGLIAFGAALQACAPEAPAEEPEPEPQTPVVATPEQPAPPAPPAAQPVAQPVSYPGYAPTGADAARADDVSVPLTALGGGLVLVAAGAAGHGMRGRAVRTRN
jgi:hypothetical protein